MGINFYLNLVFMSEYCRSLRLALKRTQAVIFCLNNVSVSKLDVAAYFVSKYDFLKKPPIMNYNLRLLFDIWHNYLCIYK